MLLPANQLVCKQVILKVFDNDPFHDFAYPAGQGDWSVVTKIGCNTAFGYRGNYRTSPSIGDRANGHRVVK